MTSAQASPPRPRVYRGRNLEELIPQIRSELGPDAVITRQRDGLAGGIGGFFQRRFVEVEAQPGEPRAPRFDAYVGADDPPAGGTYAPPRRPANGDGATAEGLESEAVRLLLEQASPFISAVPAVGARPDAEPELPPPAPAAEPAEPSFAEHLGAATAAERQRPEPAPVPASPPPRPFEPPVLSSLSRRRAPGHRASHPALSETPAQAAALEHKLAASGLSPSLAEEVVAEAVSHWIPFGSPCQLKRLTRLALARRIPVQGSFGGGGGRRLAFVGAGGSGKTLCVARLACAYARGSDLAVACVSLRPRDGGAELFALLAGTGVSVDAVDDGAQLTELLDALPQRTLVAIDTPSVSPGSDHAVGELAGELAATSATEVHLTLPATLSGAATQDLTGGLSPLGFSYIALTHADETAHLGTSMGVAMTTRPISYLARGTVVDDGLEPADPATIAALLLQ